MSLYRLIKFRLKGNFMEFKFEYGKNYIYNKSMNC